MQWLFIPTTYSSDASEIQGNLTQSRGGTKRGDWFEILGPSPQGRDEGAMVGGQEEGGYFFSWKAMIKEQKWA